MAVSIKSEKEIELMRVSCKNLSVMFDELEKIIKPGISTWEINKVGEEIIRDFGCIPNFKNYEGYPASIPLLLRQVLHLLGDLVALVDGQLLLVQRLFDRCGGVLVDLHHLAHGALPKPHRVSQDRKSVV